MVAKYLSESDQGTEVALCNPVLVEGADGGGAYNFLVGTKGAESTLSVVYSMVPTNYLTIVLDL